MAYRVGYIQVMKYSTTPGGALSSAGIVTGGTRTEESEILEIRTVGDYTPKQLREGLVKVSGSATLELQSVGILTLGQRVSNKSLSTYGQLPEFDILLGCFKEWVKHKNCKIDSISIEATRGEPLRATINWKGISYEDGTVYNEHIVATAPVLMWYNGKIEGYDCELLSASISISHNTDWLPIIDSTLSPKRGAKYIVEKQQSVTANLKILAPGSTNLKADSLSYISSVVLTFVGTYQVKITLKNLKPNVHEMPLTPTELIEYGVNFSVQDWEISE